MTKAAAKVAWPHNFTSLFGVNHLILNSLEDLQKNAVSDKLFSCAIDCITSFDNHWFKGITAAGLPSNIFPANASI